MGFEPETGKRIERGAILSDDRRHRYMLWRIWDHGLPLMGFVLLNPSTADETTDDPTVEWCERFADTHDYGGIVVGNLCSFRSPDPAALLRCDKPVGPENGHHLRSLAEQCRTVVVGWGNSGLGHPAARLQAAAALRGTPAFCLGRTVASAPIHPAYFVREPRAVPRLQTWEWGG